jgi:hypothetical protein
MKSLRVLATLLVCAAAMVVAGAAQKPGPPQKEPPPDYFPLRVGDWWKFKSTATTGTSEFTITVVDSEKTASGGTLFVVETSTMKPMIRDWYSKGDGWVNMHKQLYLANNMTTSYEPVRTYLRNPLGAGQTWSWKGAGMMNVPIDESSSCVGAEEVVVPAGKFMAMKVATVVIQGGARVEKTYWYANWIGLVKSQTSSGPVQSSTELVDYSFKRR